MGAPTAQATITTDNVEAGRQACGYIADKLGGKGNVLIVNGPPVSGVIDRVKGCKEVFATHPDIKILSDNQNGIGTREGGLNVTTGLLTAHDDVNAILRYASQIYDTMLCSQAVWIIPNILEPAKMGEMQIRPKLMTELNAPQDPDEHHAIDEWYVAITVSPMVIKYGDCEKGFEEIGDGWHKGSVVALSEVVTLPVEDDGSSDEEGSS